MDKDNIKIDFEQARAKHLAFKSQLRSFLYGIEKDEAALRSAETCALGKWLAGHASETYRNIQEMKELEDVHRDIHRKASDLIDLYKEGKQNAARAGLASVEAIADQLLVLLGEVEKKAGGLASSLPSQPFLTREDGLAELKDLMQANQELEKIIREYSDAAVKEHRLLYDVFMQLPAHISLVMGPEFVFELVNPPAQAVIEGKDVIGKKVSEAFPELVEQGFVGLLDHVYQTGETYVAKELPARLRLSDGTFQEYVVDVSYLPLRDTTGKTIGVISFSYDVTDAVQARRKIQENEERFRFMSDALPNQAWTARADGSLDYVNERTIQYFRKSADDIIGEGWKNVVHPEDLPAVAQAWSNSLATLEPYRVEFRLMCHDGNYRWHLAQANAFKSSSGEVKWYGSNTDIHDLKVLQDKLQQSYADLEVKVRFRNIELERQNLELQEKLDRLGQQQ